MNNLVQKIQEWVKDRGLDTQNPRIQMCKLMEEAGELAAAINKDRIRDSADSIGDSVVVLICLSQQLGLDFTNCVAIAYEQIKDRKGKLINGVFVKEGDY